MSIMANAGGLALGQVRLLRKSARRAKLRLITDPLESAEAAGLRYIRDDAPGIRRLRRGKRFCYAGPDGKVIRSAEELRRIRALVIPPAWTDVWICLSPRGHLQATGRDARGRKQYRYHPRWRSTRDETKYDRLIAFGNALPQIRARVEEALAQPGLSRNKVLATIVRLLETTLIRVGNEEYARANGSFGLTTLRNRHADVNGRSVYFTFRGKSGVRHRIRISDRRLARIVRRCQDLPGQELFQYLNEDGTPRSIDSADVNAYLQEISGQEFTAKDFRTWAGTVLAATALRQMQSCDSPTQAKGNVGSAIESVARRLGNTKAICRKCYVHPDVISAYLDGSLPEALCLPREKEKAVSLADLSAEEAAVLHFLHERLRHESATANGR